MRQRTLATAAATLRHTNLMRMAAAGYDRAAPSPAEPPAKHDQPEIYAAGGDPGRVRIKWSCPRCHRRNDRPIAWRPEAETKECVVCAFCRLPQSFTMTKTEPEGRKESAA